jgi:hypothetical protein
MNQRRNHNERNGEIWQKSAILDSPSGISIILLIATWKMLSLVSIVFKEISLVKER